LGRSPRRGHGNPLQYSCLENPHGQRSLVGYSLWGLKELDTTKHSKMLNTERKTHNEREEKVHGETHTELYMTQQFHSWIQTQEK